MASKQKNYTSEFKAKVVLGVVSGQRSISEGESRSQGAFIGDQPLAQ